MTIVEATDILLKIPNLTCRERTAVKTVVAMIDRKYMDKICDSYYSLDIQDLPDEQWRDVSPATKGFIKSAISGVSKVFTRAK